MSGTKLRSWREQGDALRVVVFEDRLASRIVGDVRTRRRRGARPPEQIYACTLRDLGASDRAALMARFCSSEWFTRYGEVPDRSEQLSLEEAFYRFLCGEDVGLADVRKAEFGEAMIRALTVQPRPAFHVPPEIKRAAFGYYVVVTRNGEDYVFAAAGGRLLRGRVDNFG